MHESPGSAFATIIAVGIILFLLFMALRALMLWYWRINHIVGRLDEIIMLLKKDKK